MRYRPKPALVEAFQLIGGSYVVVPEGGEPRIAEASEFEAAFEPLDELELPIGKVPENPSHPLPSDEWTGRRPNRGRPLGQTNIEDRHAEDAVPLHEAMRARRQVRMEADERQRLRDRAIGREHTPEDLRPAAEKMQEAIAARTVPGGPGAPAPVDVERAIEETRRELDERQSNFAAIDGGRPKYRQLEEGEKPGTGKKACPRCNWSNPASGRKCVNTTCRKKFG